METRTKIQKKKAQRLPLFLVVLLCLIPIVAYFSFAMSTLDVTISNNDVEHVNHSNHHSSRVKETSSLGVECESFEYGDVSPAPDVVSIFNCNSEAGKCKWHYPAKFFNADCGIGRDYVNQVQLLQRLHEENELWLSGPPIIIPWAAFSPKVKTPDFRTEPFPTHNLSMTHVHKTGGTSLVSAFSSILGKGAKGKRHTVYMPPRKGAKPADCVKGRKLSCHPIISSPGNVAIHSKRANESSRFLDGAVKYRSEWGASDHTLFAVIRDPAERFISAIGQATGAFGSTTNGIGNKLIKECLKSTSKETLSCFVDLVQNNGTLIEVHFTPMALEISFATMWKDIPVAVFPFEEVPTLLSELGTNPNFKRKDGHKKGYRKDPVLTNMTLSDYDQDSLTKLCNIYWMDVLFLNNIGYESNCDYLLDEQS